MRAIAVSAVHDSASAGPSGRRRGAAAAPRPRAALPSDASPTTSMSSSRSKKVRSPVRTTAWSSTSSTRMGAESATRRPPAGRRRWARCAGLACAVATAAPARDVASECSRDGCCSPFVTRRFSPPPGSARRGRRAARSCRASHRHPRRRSPARARRSTPITSTRISGYERPDVARRGRGRRRARAAAGR